VPKHGQERKLAKAIGRRVGRACCPADLPAQRSGRTIAVAERFDPRSKTCTAGGHRLPSLSLRTRLWSCRWTCQGLAHPYDRDVNAREEHQECPGVGGVCLWQEMPVGKFGPCAFGVNQEPPDASPVGIRSFSAGLAKAGLPAEPGCWRRACRRPHADIVGEAGLGWGRGQLRHALEVRSHWSDTMRACPTD
jgi:hypothetical protein